MKKIPTLFARNMETDRRVRDEVTPGCEWVLNGEGVATRKWDGTCCAYRNGVFVKRYDARPGRIPPAGFEPCEDEPAAVTGSLPGWVPVGDGPEDKYFREGWDNSSFAKHPHLIPPGVTFELVGPKIQHNDGGGDRHVLVQHGTDSLHVDAASWGFEGLRVFLEEADIEGIVWWRDVYDPSCDKAKLKRRDVGFPWPVRR